MNIAIDCRFITMNTDGISRYTMNLVNALLARDRSSKYFLIYNSQEVYEALMRLCSNSSRCSLLYVRYGPFSVLTQILLPFVLKRNSVDVFYSMNFSSPLFFKKYKIIITVHDLIPYMFPQWLAKSKKQKVYSLYRFVTRLCIQKADRIITDSYHSQKDIIDNFSNCEDKIIVIYPGVDFERFSLSGDIHKSDNFRERYGLPHGKKLIMYVGRHDPSKNLIGFTKAFGMLRNRMDDVFLVIGGKKDFRFPELYRVIREQGLADDVVVTGFIKNSDLLLFYQSADLFVFPSFYEGFGLPPLEALACGCPVVCSRSSSLPEVLGDAVMYFDPYDTADIARVMHRVLTEQGLVSIMVRKGKQLVGTFTWQKTADRVFDVLEGLDATRQQ